MKHHYTKKEREKKRKQRTPPNITPHSLSSPAQKIIHTKTVYEYSDVKTDDTQY